MSIIKIANLRTPEERFNSLPDFPYQPKYLQHGDLRMTYIDEKTGSGAETYLCLHGEPTWSYLFRKMIPVFLNYTTLNPPTVSRRVVAPDLFGFGRSDKPVQDSDYTFTFHRDTLLHFIETLDLTNITLVVQDWGGLLGLTLPLAAPHRFKRFMVMNTALATGTGLSQGFLDWRDYNNRTPDMPVGTMMGRSVKHLSKAEAAAYDAPFPSQAYKAGVRRFPNMVMLEEGMDGVDVSKQSLEFYRTSDLFAAEDVFMACGMKDPVLGPRVMRGLARVWRHGCYYAEIEEAGHFVQEWGERVARLAIQTFELGKEVEGVRLVKVDKASL